MTDMTDPRVTEYRDALASVSEIQGDVLVPVDPATLNESESADRYRRALGPYCAFHAEVTPAVARVPMMESLHVSGRIPIGIVTTAFEASADELARLDWFLQES